jgi:hypothetical protein
MMHNGAAVAVRPSPTAGGGLARFRQILNLTKPRQAGVWLGREQTEFAARADSNSTKTLQLKRCCIALQKRTMTDESLGTKPEKLPKTKAELEALVLAELRAASDCGGAVHVTVVAFDDYRVGATWEVASCNAGTSAPEACETALCDIVSRLQQHFDIAA